MPGQPSEKVTSATSNPLHRGSGPARAQRGPGFVFACTHTHTPLPADGARYFFIAYLILGTASLALTSVFRLVGCLFQNAAAANAVAGFMLLMLIVNSGFIIVRSALPPWIVYFYWISPFAYSIRALVVNEFTSPRWQDLPSAQPGVSLGDASLELLDFYTERCAPARRTAVARQSVGA